MGDEALTYYILTAANRTSVNNDIINERLPAPEPISFVLSGSVVSGPIIIVGATPKPSAHTSSSSSSLSFSVPEPEPDPVSITSEALIALYSYESGNWK